MMEWAYLAKTGRTARSFSEYPLLTLQALLFHSEIAQRELQTLIAPVARHWTEIESVEAQQRRFQSVPGQRRKLRMPKSYDEPIITGDPVTDAWERAIARGEIPDMGKPGEPLKKGK